MGWYQSYLVGYIHTLSVPNLVIKHGWKISVVRWFSQPCLHWSEIFSSELISILWTSENPMNQKRLKIDDFPLIPWTSEKIISASSILHWCRNTMIVSCGSWSRPEVLHDAGRQFNLKHDGFNQSWITNGELIWIIIGSYNYWGHPLSSMATGNPQWRFERGHVWLEGTETMKPVAGVVKKPRKPTRSEVRLGYSR